MSEKTWWLLDRYQVNSKFEITNTKTNKQLKRTVKGYTIGYYIQDRFYSLKQLQSMLKEKKEVVCPF